MRIAFIYFILRLYSYAMGIAIAKIMLWEIAIVPLPEAGVNPKMWDRHSWVL